jgi:SAM-dependent methyltransferase
MPKPKRQPVIHPFDVLHGTDTSGLIPGTEIAKDTSAAVEDLTAYYGVAPSILQGLLDIWLDRTAPEPIERTIFYDVGAGKGRAMLLASRYPFLRVEGVELSPALADIAKANIKRWQRDPAAYALAPLKLSCADATKHPVPSSPTLAFLFHPFELPVLRRFLRHVERSITESPRPFDLLYANAEHDSLLDRHPAFKRLWSGRVAMSGADHVADLAAIAEQEEYGSTGDELCAIYRFTGRKRNSWNSSRTRNQSSIAPVSSSG